MNELIFFSLLSTGRGILVVFYQSEHVSDAGAQLNGLLDENGLQERMHSLNFLIYSSAT